MVIAIFYNVVEQIQEGATPTIIPSQPRERVQRLISEKGQQRNEGDNPMIVVILGQVPRTY